MRAGQIVGMAFLCCALLASRPGMAQDRGPVLAHNIMGGAMAGATTGLAAGLLAYGLTKNTEPETVLLGSVYGFLTGAVVGTGFGIYEISAGSPGTGYTVAEYVSGGTGIGAFLGLVVATIPYLRDHQSEDFMVGLGLGGVIGAAFGLGFAVLDIQTRGPQGDVLLSGELGVHPGMLSPLIPGAEADREPVWQCRLVKVDF